MATYNKAAFQNTSLSTPVVDDDYKKQLAMQLARTKAKGNNPADSSPAFGGGRKETTPQDTEKKEEPMPAETRQAPRGLTTNQAALDRAMRTVSTDKEKDLGNIDTSMAKSFGGSYQAGSGAAQGIVNAPGGLTPGIGLGTTYTTGGRDVVDPGSIPPTLPGAPDAPDDLQDLTEAAIRDLLTGAGVDTAEEKEARRQQAAVDEAKKIQALRAKTGLGGMGLTGAAGALEAQIRAEGTRGRAITEAELDRAAREEALRRTQVGIGAGQAERGMGIKEEVYGLERDLYEKELDRDIDGDGTVAGEPVSDTVGNNDPSDNPGAEEEDDFELSISDSERTAKALLEEQYGVKLDDLSEGSGTDKLSPINRKITSYTDQYGRTVEIFQRYAFFGIPKDPPEYFKKTIE
jgi:hypothetical protein